MAYFTFHSPSRLLLLGSLLLLGLLAFAPAFSNPFVADDPDFILHWPALRSLHSLPDLLQGQLPPAHLGTYRPVRSLLYWLVFRVSGTYPFGYHLFAFLVHFTNTLLVFFIARRLTHRLLPAYLTALFFLLHPLHTEAVTFITASFDTAAFSFLFASFFTYLHSLGSTRRSLLPLSLFLALLAFATNEITLILPLLLISYHLFYPKGGSSLRSYRSSLFLFGFVALSFYLLRSALSSPFIRDALQVESFALRLLVSAKAFSLYLWQLFFPLRLSLVHELPGNISTYTLPELNRSAVVSQSITQPENLFFLTLPLLILGLIGRLRSRAPHLAFGLVWLLLSLLPVLNLVPGATLYAERYAYLASFGFCYVLALLLTDLLTRKPLQRKFLGLFLIVVITAGYFTLTFTRSADWRSDITLWRSATAIHPDNSLSYLLLARAYRVAGEPVEAVNSYQQALELAPSLIPAHLELADLYFLQKNYSAAYPHYLHALALDPDLSLARENLNRLCQTYSCPSLPPTTPTP